MSKKKGLKKFGVGVGHFFISKNARRKSFHLQPAKPKQPANWNSHNLIPFGSNYLKIRFHKVFCSTNAQKVQSSSPAKKIFPIFLGDFLGAAKIGSAEVR